MRTTEAKLQEAEVLIKEIKAMRLLQKSYFKAVFEKDEKRKWEILPQSKSQEKKVDAMIDQYYKNDENTLF